MNGVKLKSLEIRNFRGIKAYKLPFEDSKSMVICGSNGTGKSSFVNALQYIFTNSINISDDSDVNKDNKSIPHIDANEEDVFIKAEFSQGTVTKTFNNEPQYTEGLGKIIDKSFTYNSFILNRSKLLGFVDAGERERYNRLSNLFGFKKLDDIEDSFKKGKRELNSSLKNYNESNYSILKNISNQLFEDKKLKDKASKSAINNLYEEIITEFNKTLEINNLPLIDENIDFKQFYSQLKDTLLYAQVDEYKENISNLLNDIDFSVENYTPLIDEYAKLIEDKLDETDLLVNILKESKKYLDGDVKSCPICGNKIDNEIISSIDNKIIKLESNSEDFKNWTIKSKNFIGELNKLVENLNNLDEIVKKLNEIIELKLDSSILISDELIIKTKDETINLIDVITNLINHNSSITNLNKDDILKDNLDLLKNYIKNQINQINLKEANNELNFIYENIDNLIEYSNNSKKINVLNNQYNEAHKTHKLFSDLKEKYVNEVISLIADDVIEFYTFIHDDEEIKNPRLVASKSKGVKLIIDSFGKDDSDPRSYSSEGHLDTLGLCIFLAAVKNLNQTPIIVLDDIIATVDMSHKDKITRLLFEKFSKYQFIITTHNKLWANQFMIMNEHYRKKGSKGFIFNEIIYWDFHFGPVFREFKSDREIIEHHLNSKYQDLPAAANGARSYLERTLYNICKEYNAMAPIEDKYEVRHLFKPAQDKLLELSKGTEFESYYGDIFDTIDKQRHPANALSHFNETNALLHISDVRPYVGAVFKLHDSVTCNECNSMLKIINKKVSCSKKSKHYSVNMKDGLQ